LKHIAPSDVVFAALIAALFVLVGMTFHEYAVSNDEGLQHHYGELIIAYYRSGFTDKSVFDFENLYLYGGLFDVVAVLLAHALPFDLYDIRHVMSAAAGIGGIVATWATARLIAGPRAGLLAGLALTVCGVWYGGMFNHTKDVPFASAMMGATFFLLRAERDRLRPRWSNVLCFGVLLGVSLGLRATGLLMCGYAAGMISVRSCAAGHQGWRCAVRLGAELSARYVPAFTVGYLIMILSWPWARPGVSGD
jgi:Dolichyl-phosphate-mannose-protein mannosyltransferase